MMTVIRKVKTDPQQKQFIEEINNENSTTMDPNIIEVQKNDDNSQSDSSIPPYNYLERFKTSATDPKLVDMTSEIKLPRCITESTVNSNQNDGFEQFDTITRQHSTIVVTPAQINALASFCIREAMHFGERYVFDYIMYIGHQSPPLIIEPLQFAIGLVRGLPKSWIFDIGNPMVKNRTEDELLEFTEYACQNQVMKKRGVGRVFQGGMMQWEFKADLSLEGPLQKFKWVGARKNRKLVELRLMERQKEKRVLAVWLSDQKANDPYNGRLWLRKGYPKCGDSARIENVKRRWAVAIWLTWRVLFERN